MLSVEERLRNIETSLDSALHKPSNAYSKPVGNVGDVTGWIPPVGGRLSIVHNDPGTSLVETNLAVIPSSTDTGAETVTFSAAHNFPTGQAVTVTATGGGLTAGTVYFINAVSATVLSFHTSYGDAINGTNKVNLTASITATIFSAYLYFVPYNGNQLPTWNGEKWIWHTYKNELSLNLQTANGGSPLTANKVYDIFVVNESGNLVLKAVEWTNATTRATALTSINGIDVLTGKVAYTYLGTVYAIITGRIASSKNYRHIWNRYNRVRKWVKASRATASWSVSAGTGLQEIPSSARGYYVIGKAQVGVLSHNHYNTVAGTNTGQLYVSNTGATGSSCFLEKNGSNYYLYEYPTVQQELPAGSYSIYLQQYTGASTTMTVYGEASAPQLGGYLMSEW